ncbi:GTP cyclohydrolase IIa [Stetteria hydrogenophila]
MPELASRISVLELVGFREWTESLGPDREWIIQSVQARVYARVQEEAAKHEAIVLPARYDYMLILSSNVDARGLRRILRAAESVSPVPVRIGSACSSTPLAAEEAAFNLLQDAKPGGLEYGGCRSEEAAAVAHVDLNDVTGLTLKLGAYKAYHMIVELVERVESMLIQAGVITQYLGGDNLLLVLPLNSARDLAREAVKISDLKAGVGVSRTYRRAMALATEALSEIRSGSVKDKVYSKIG